MIEEERCLLEQKASDYPLGLPTPFTTINRFELMRRSSRKALNSWAKPQSCSSNSVTILHQGKRGQISIFLFIFISKVNLYFLNKSKNFILIFTEENGTSLKHSELNQV